MKALRYLLIVMSLVSVLSVSAQNLAQRPEAQMHSTSGMVYSGSTLPQAAASGAMLTGSQVGTYTPAKTHPGHIRRAVDDDDKEDVPVPGDNTDPDFTPLGDAAWPLMMLACVYALMRVFLIVKRKKQ